MGSLVALLAITFFIIPSYAAAQVVVPENVAKNIESWIGVPAEYMGSPRDIIVFVIIPFVVAALVMHGIWKEVGIFNNGAANFWIPVLMVFASFQFGFFKFVKALYGSTQSLIFAGAAIMAYVITAKVRQRVGSFGYSGIFSGIVGYVLDAVGLGIAFGGMAGAFSGGRFGPLVYIAFSVGAALGIFVLWWNKKGRKTGNLKNLLEQEDQIEKELIVLEAKLLKLNKESDDAPNPGARGIIEDEMVDIKKRIDRLRAKEEVVADKTD